MSVTATSVFEVGRWDGQEWDGQEWDGQEWDGQEWDGQEWDSGTGDLTGISGQGRIVIDNDGTHTMVLDYEVS